MDARELRIGNLVKDSLHGYSGNVNAIFGIDCLLEDINTHEGWQPLTDQLEGIPLTEEWLLKLGWKEYELRPYSDQIAWIHGEDNKRLILSYGNIFKPIMAGFICITQKDFTKDNNPVDYVHQLQNLYFALTGKELTITN